MQEAWSDLACRLVSLAAILISFLAAPAYSIDCYKCTSINGKTTECEDIFDTTVKTVHLIQRQCVYGFFKGTHCIKLNGKREDGTHIMVRDCSNADWGSHCGDIRYVYGNKEERINGCLEACNYDGCNAATTAHHSPSFPVILALPVTMALTFLLRDVSAASL